MITTPDIKKTVNEKFDLHAKEGIDLLRQKYDYTAVLSHMCFKFTSIQNYQEFVSVAGQSLGHVTTETFKGKEIAWCKLSDPVRKDDLVLEWLEMVEPRFEANEYNGVTSIGYVASELTEVKKYSSFDDNMLFRYMPESVHP